MKTKESTANTILNRLFLQAAGDLLSVNGIMGTVVREADEETCLHTRPSYVSVLGATGEGIALSSMITVERELLIKLHPLATADISQADLEDWCRELNNQLVGRVKNRLLHYGVVVVLSLPVLLQGRDVSPVAMPDVTVNRHAIRTWNGQISLSLSTFMDDDVELVQLEHMTEEVLLEGAVSLF